MDLEFNNSDMNFLKVANEKEDFGNLPNPFATTNPIYEEASIELDENPDIKQNSYDIDNEVSASDKVVFGTENRLNDFDGKILEEKAYNGIDNEILKLELQINYVENNIAKVNSEIQVVKDLKNSTGIAELEKRKERLMKELAFLNSHYQQLGVGANFSTQFSKAITFKPHIKLLNDLKEIFTSQVLMKISRTFNRNYKLKQALETLSNINASVDELISMQTPYGETLKRYEKLTNYLNHANRIHSVISRSINIS